MAIRLKANIRSHQNRIYTIELHDNELGTDADVYFDTVYPGAQITWEGDQNDFYKRVIPSKASFTMILTSNQYGSAQQTALNSFYADLQISSEGRFYLRIKEGAETIFIGKLLLDVGELTLSPMRELRITAVDGLADLKDVEFRPKEETLLGQFLPKSFTYHIIDILQRNDVVDYFYGDDDTILQTYIRWKESALGANDDFFQEIMVRNQWYDQVNPFFRRYQNCHKVLTEILAGFNSRIYFSRGFYRVEQISAKAMLAPTVLRYYKKGLDDLKAIVGTGPSSLNTNNFDTDQNLNINAFPATKLLAPFKSVELIQRSVFYNYFPEEYTLRSIYSSDPSEDIEDYGPYDLGDVIAGSYRFVFDLKIKNTSLLGDLIDASNTATPALTAPNKTLELWIEFEIKFTVGAWYLANDLIRLTGAESQNAISGNLIPYFEANWTTNTSGRLKLMYKLYDDERLASDVGGNIFWFLGSRIGRVINILGSTDEVPEDGPVEIEITDIKFHRADVDTGFGQTEPPLTEIDIPRDKIDWEWTPQSRIILANQVGDVFEQPDRISIFEINDLKNKINYKIEFPFSDSPDNDIDFRLMRLSDGQFLPTTQWTDPTAGADTLQRLAMKEVLALRASPVQVFNTIMEHRTSPRIFHYSDRVVINANLYIPMRMDIFLGSGDVNALWHQISANFAPIIDRSPDKRDPNIPTFPTPATVGNGDMRPPQGLLYTEFWAFENVTDAYVTLTDFGLLNWVMPDEELNKKRWSVWVNGVKQRLVEGGPLTQGKYDFDEGNDRLLFFRALNGAYVEVKFENHIS